VGRTARVAPPGTTFFAVTFFIVTVIANRGFGTRRVVCYRFLGSRATRVLANSVIVLGVAVVVTGTAATSTITTLTLAA